MNPELQELIERFERKEHVWTNRGPERRPASYELGAQDWATWCGAGMRGREYKGRPVAPSYCDSSFALHGNSCASV